MGRTATRRDVFAIGIAGVLVGALLATVVLLGLPAGAATGDYVVLGQANKSGETTTLKYRDGTPLQLIGRRPMIVSSRKKVTRLNADYLDGQSANLLAPRAAFAGPAAYGSICSTPECSATVLSTSIQVPREGVLLIGAHLDLERSAGTTSDLVGCGIMVNNSAINYGQVGWSEIQLDPYPNGAAGEEIDCAVTGWKLVDPGTVSVQLKVTAVEDTDTKIGTGGSLWAMWVPLDGATGQWFG